MKRFGVFVDVEMKSLFEATWAFPELYGVVEIGIEKSSQLAKDSC